MIRGKKRICGFFIFCMMIMCMVSDRSVSYAMQTSEPAIQETQAESDEMSDEEVLKELVKENLIDGPLTEEDLEDDMTDEEVSQMMDEVLKEFGGMSGDQLDVEELNVQKVVGPELTVSKLSDGSIRYGIPNGSYFISNVPAGMVTTGPVKMAVSQSIAAVVRYNDELDTIPDSWVFEKPGTYRIRLISYNIQANGNADYNAYEVNFHFTIIGQTDGSIGMMPAPEDFRISGVWLEGQKMDVENDRGFFLHEDGRYTFRFTDRKTGTIQKETSFVRDTKAPYLIFSKEIVDGKADAPMDFEPSEPGCKVLVGYNGHYGYVSEYKLNSPGSYELTVEDSVGNIRVYHLALNQVFRILDLRLIGAGLILLAMAIGRMILIRRDIRVL